MKRIFSLVCAIVLALAMISPVSASTPANEDLTDSVRSQVRSYAASIAQSNSIQNAASALAKHGLTQGGKKLSVGKSHALTAALWSTELLQEGLTQSISQLIYMMQETNPTGTEYVRGYCVWDGDDSFFGAYRNFSPNLLAISEDMSLIFQRPYTGSKNSHDAAMEWMSGRTAMNAKIVWLNTTASTMEYQVSCYISDRFDFDTASNSGFKNLISGLGTRLFREFDWESTVTFNITVPYDCDHTTGSYHWVYDAGNNSFTTLTDGGFTANPVIRHKHNTDQSYFELEDTAELRADRPWVLEYDVRQPAVTTLAPHNHASTQDPALVQHYYMSTALLRYNRTEISEAVREKYQLKDLYPTQSHYYGTFYKNAFSYSNKIYYTFRLENQISANGGNMIYLTILKRDTGAVLVDRTPLDSFYNYAVWYDNHINNSTSEDWSDAKGWVSGKDIFISYIGNRSHVFRESNFDLRIWENGKDAPNGSSCTEVITSPTCTAKGYTTYTCISCGYTCKGSYTPAAGHAWGSWESISPTLNRRSCTACGEAEEETILLSGDANGDGKVNAPDLILLRQYLAGWDVTIHAADCNGDGQTTALDLIRLRQYLAGWDVALGS